MIERSEKFFEKVRNNSSESRNRTQRDKTKINILSMRLNN